MHKPLLKPDGLERARCDLAKESRDVWPAKSAKAVLAWVANVGVAIVERRAESDENQEAMKVSLEEYVDVYPLADVATVSHITRNGIENVRGLANSALHREPGVEIRHVVYAGHRGSDFLLELIRAKVAGLVEKL
jgi:hypothetical protein